MIPGMHVPVLLDISGLCPEHTDAALEFIAKAVGDDPGPSIWDQHPNPHIRRIVEIFSQRGTTRISGLTDELLRWASGDLQVLTAARAARPAGAMVRWSSQELDLIRQYLQSIGPAEYSLDDWLMVVDYLVQRYLPADDMRTEADWLATRSNMMGRLQAVVAADLTAAAVDKVVAALPVSIASAESTFGMTPVQRAAIEYGRARCAENVVAFTDTARHKLRRIIVDHSEAQILGDRVKGYGALETRLRDEQGMMNRDWRRIAVTEAGENLNQGVVASVPTGSRMRRVEKYRGACAHCRAIDGRVVRVVSASAPDKNWDTEIWAGKTNQGLSASPRKRVGTNLVEREPKEMWSIAAGVQHPNCRGGWVHLAESTRPVDPKFSDWMDQVLGRK